MSKSQDFTDVVVKQESENKGNQNELPVGQIGWLEQQTKASGETETRLFQLHFPQSTHGFGQYVRETFFERVAFTLYAEL